MSTDKGIQISVDIADQQVARLLAEVDRHLNNATPAMRAIGEIVHRSIARNFASAGRPLAWKKSRRAKEEGGQTLTDTARLRRSFTVEAGRDYAAVGTNDVRAAVHHLGAAKGSFGRHAVRVGEHVRRLAGGRQIQVRSHLRQQAFPWGAIPARPFMVVQTEDWTQIASALARYLSGA